MKIGVVQTRPAKGDIPANIARHRQLIDLAVANGADTVIFPELSLTGYEPSLAKTLAVDPHDHRFNVFQDIADRRRITIGVGAPTHDEAGVCISLIVFQPDRPRWTYSKQHLHPDEEPFFVPGSRSAGLIDGVALAICYEISVPEHAQRASARGATVYLASVAKFLNGIEKANARLADIARTHAMTVLMANCVGLSDGAECAGNTAVWNSDGALMMQLNDRDEGLIVHDTDACESISAYLRP